MTDRYLQWTRRLCLWTHPVAFAVAAQWQHVKPVKRSVVNASRFFPLNALDGGSGTKKNNKCGRSRTLSALLGYALEDLSFLSVFYL